MKTIVLSRALADSSTAAAAAAGIAGVGSSRLLKGQAQIERSLAQRGEDQGRMGMIEVEEAAPSGAEPLASGLRSLLHTARPLQGAGMAERMLHQQQGRNAIESNTGRGAR